MSELYRQLCNLFIRPTRQQYSPYDLGSPIIQNLGRRKDFDLRNPRGMLLKCSFFQPSRAYEGCVVYLHSLNGSRLESAHMAKRFLNIGIAFANLDMSGSGHSEGEYVSLGYHERLDAKTLIDYLHNEYGIKLFGIWGRSMGAVTALNAALELQKSSETFVTCAVLDSPYFSLMDLALEIADRRIGLPSLLVKAGMLLIRSSIEDKVNFRLDDLEMKEILKYIRIPLLILASKEDELINWHHSQKIYNEYLLKDKELFFIKGSHSSVRDEQVISKIVAYMQKNLKIGEHKLRRNMSTVGEPIRPKQLTTVKSSQNLFSESVSPIRRVRSITPSYVMPRPSIKLSDKYRHEEGRYKTQKTIYEEEENFPTGTTTETEEPCHMNIISQKLLKMRPKNITGGVKKFSESKSHQEEEISPRKGAKVVTSNRLLKLKKKPNITPALLENNKLNHNPYLTNANLVKLIDEQDNI